MAKQQQQQPPATKINVVDLKEIDFAKIEFKKPCKSMNGRLVYLSYDKEDYLYFHFPALRIPFPMKANKWNGYNLCVEFDEGRKRQAAFLERLRSIDEFLVKSIVENSTVWFEKQYSEEEGRDCFVSPIREHSAFKPKISPKVIFSEKELKTNIYDAENKALDFENRTLEEVFLKGKYAMGILQISGLWINAENRVSPILKVVQVKVMDPPPEKRRLDPEIGSQVDKKPRVSTEQLRNIFGGDDDDDMVSIRTVIGGMPQ